MKNPFSKTAFSIFLAGITLLFLISISPLCAQVKLTEQIRSIPTYPVGEADKNPMFFKGESYQGASKIIYPYALNDVISNDRIMMDWKELVLENEYIRLGVTPEIGGKLYYATDKTNGYHFIYKNEVVKPGNIGMTGAWVSGGIEWCVLHHHRASTFLPVDYSTMEHEDGSKTIYIGETEPRHRMRWTIGITMFPGRSYFCAEVKIHNPTPLTHSFLYWANVAAHTNKDYQVIFPPSVQLATYHAKNSFTRWPVSTQVYNNEDFTRGVDLSWWINSVRQNSYFAHDLKEDFMGGYDHGREAGTVHVADHNIVKGAKLWEWGSGKAGQETEAKLTENSGPYVEIMVGAFSDNQPDYSWIRPYETKSFKQYWYPVKDIGGFKHASLEGAVNLELRGKEGVFLGYYSTRLIQKAKVILKNKGQVIFEKEITISPEKPFTSLIKVPGNIEITDLYTELTDLSVPEVVLSYQPVKQDPLPPLPETVKRPPSPQDIATIEELYLTGSRIQQFYNPTLNAMDYYVEALRRDPGDIRTNTAVGLIHFRNADYSKARIYFSKAIERLTRDFTRPANCEALYLQGLTLKAMELWEEATDTLYRASWDYAWHTPAYLELARISSLQGNFNRALDQVLESLSTNTRNNSGIHLQAALLRLTGKPAEGEALMQEILEKDPLDFRAGYEQYLCLRAMKNESSAEQCKVQLLQKMRESDQNFLELAIAYLNDGLSEEAGSVLSACPDKSQMIVYYLGFLANRKGDRESAARFMREASDMPVDYGFPFRAESVKVLELASEYLPGNARPWYYLGNLYFDRQPAKAMECWEKAVQLEPELAIAWRNLGWGNYYFRKDIDKAIDAYEHAIELKKDDPVYYAELDPLYEKANVSIQTRAKLFDDRNEVVKKRDDAFVRQIMVLNLSGQAGKSVEYLKGISFHFREGSSRVRDITADAHILYGSEKLVQGKNKEALELFVKVLEPADHDRKGDPRNPQVNYFTGLAWEALGNRKAAAECFKNSASQTPEEISYIMYYQGLSNLKLGKREAAEECFRKLVNEGERLLKDGESVDFFAKFGEKETADVFASRANTMSGLGYKGLNMKDKARENLGRAVELSASNLWAGYELKNL